MRFDNIGFFWEDAHITEKGHKGGVKVARPLAPIPDNGWKAPSEFPNLFNEKLLGVDVETFDPELKTHGPGWARGVGHLVGVSVATASKGWYFPIAHEVRPEDNMDPAPVLKYLADLLNTPMDKVGANIAYDSGWLRETGIHMAGRLYDVQYAEALINETSKDYSLEAIARLYLGTGKVSSVLYEWLSRSYGGTVDGKQRANIYRAPPNLVGPYAEADATEPVKILLKQREVLLELGMWDLFLMECDLIPVLEGMRFRGLPINPERAEQVESELAKDEDAAQEKLDELAGFSVGVNSSKDLAQLFDKCGIAYPNTKKGNPSFTKKFLASNASTPALLVNDVRKIGKAKGTFVRNAILNKHIDGIVYPSFHPLRGEEGGAVSGRYSSSMPNAQQFPARDPRMGPLIRSLFVPEVGFSQWLKLDLSQIEYRMFAHYSGDERLILEYQIKGTDYHAIVSGFLNNLLDRKIIKNFNFMSLYGGGLSLTIEMLNEELSVEQIEDLVLRFELQHGTNDLTQVLAVHFTELYTTNFPAAKTSLDACSAEAASTGEIRTILNRRSTFELYEPAQRYSRGIALPLKQALSQYGGNIRRASTYRALNRRLQGSAADLLKKGMLDAYKAGLFNSDRLGFPHVTVHDELDFSYHPDMRADFYELQQTIERAIPLKVPVIMDAEVGTNWGNVKEFDLSK